LSGEPVNNESEPFDEESPNDESQEDPLDVAFAQYLRRCDEGEFVSREEFLAQFEPPLADQLKELMLSADRIGQMTQVRKFAGEDGQNKGGETIHVSAGNGGLSGDEDLNLTLPLASRREGDHGPTLPFDLGDYELIEVIGRGGMGVVYRANQKELQREVAVKMIRSGVLASEAEVKRFYTEAQAAARLHHPGIVAVHQFGRRADHHFFSMEYIAGTDLQRKINGGVLDPKQAARYVRDVARAIDHAHDKGVLHRDLKPANVLIDTSDEIHVTDFGLAKHIDGDSSVTGSGDALGTPHYMAPEQAGGYSDRATRQSDVYSLGAILFAALTGRPPIVADTVMQTLVQVVHEPAPLVRSVRPETPVDLETIIAKCLEKRPAKRYETAGELADELDAFLDDRPIKSRPRNAAVRALSWFAGVPLVGALSGRRVLTSSHGHRRFQAAMLLLMLVAPLAAAAALLYVRHFKDAMPATVRIAGGLEGGVYSDLASNLAKVFFDKLSVQSVVQPSGGSVDNRQMLIDGRVDLAPLQANLVYGDEVCVVAPLFHEVLYVISHVDSGVNRLEQLRDQTIAIGPPGSGSRATAELVIESLPIDLSQATFVDSPWSSLFSESPPDVALMCIGRGSPLVDQLLGSGNWQLLSIPNCVDLSLEHPTLLPMQIAASDHEGLDIPADGIATVGTTGFLAARTDAPADLITRTLELIYKHPPTTQLIPRHQAAEWQGLAFHRAARKFYESKETINQSDDESSAPAAK
jgi:eukaryotic-like serine/threonine-protein kinase